jgi:4-hydroxy-tetrahydrodipicolinate reductase
LARRQKQRARRRRSPTDFMKPLRVLLVGAAGRMGQTIVELARQQPDNIDIVAACDVGDPLEPAILQAQVIVDFSHADAADEICRLAQRHKQPLVIGTTGHSAEQRSAIDKCGETIAIVLASNFSIGVNALFWLTARAAELLGEDFDVEIVEMHHRMKKDAPSGTAKTLAETLQRRRDLKQLKHGREGEVGRRTTQQIGIHAIRGGDVIGDHTVIFAGTGERLELTHRASSRETFAKGALRAAQWVKDKPAGLYSMHDVLGLNG